MPEGITLNACAAAVAELEASRRLIDALDGENTALKERLQIEKRAAQLLAELNETRRSETETLRMALAAKNETIAAKDAVIASQAKLIDSLKAKRSSPWRRIGDILIGAGAALILR